MATDQIPEQVYENAAKAWIAVRHPRWEAYSAQVGARDQADVPEFHAAVESAYRTGQKAMLDYVAKNADVLSIRIPVAADRYAMIRDLGEVKEPDRADLYCEHLPDRPPIVTNDRACSMNSRAGDSQHVGLEQTAPDCGVALSDNRPYPMVWDAPGATP